MPIHKKNNPEMMKSKIIKKKKKNTLYHLELFSKDKKREINNIAKFLA